MEKINLFQGFKESLREIVLSFSNNILSEEEVFSMLNELVHYNIFFRFFIFESFVIEALKLNKILKIESFVLALFNNYNVDFSLLHEDFKEGTRIKILKKLNLTKTLVAYREFLINSYVESHIWFKEGVKNEFYCKAVENKTTIKDVTNILFIELNQ